MMTETPVQSPLQNAQVSTNMISRSRWKTPVRGSLKIPRTHRLFASAGPKTSQVRSPTNSYEGLLKKTWRVHALSPLFKFKTSPVSLKQYGHSLDIAFSKGTSLIGSDSGQESTCSSFEIYHGLSIHADDPEAIRIQVTEKQDRMEKVVLTAVLACVDIEDPGLVDKAVSDNFTFLPLLLVCGTKQRAGILLEWLQRHFDCRSSPMEFSDTDLRWMLAVGCRQDKVKPHPILLQYDLKEVCDGINTVDCKFESAFCKEVWDRLQGNSMTEEFLTENQVFRFVSALETQLEYTMHIIFSKLSLSEVGTPLCYVSKDGKVKIFDSRGVYVILHLICEVITGKFVQGFGFFG